MTQSICTVDGCERGIKNKIHGLCGPHYKRYWRTGDVQADVPILAPRRRPQPVTDYEDGTRDCQICERRLPLDKFHNDAKAPAGKRKECKACRTSREVVRYHADAQNVRVRMARYRQENLEKVRAADNARYERDKDKRIALAIANTHVRRARLANNGYEPGITVSALRKRDGDRCYYCACEMVFKSFPKGERHDNQATLEHMTPISRGGSHTWDNCVLSCWRCNITKGTRLDFWQLTT
ncbi:HNH endonuclease [Microbacterium sp. NPDC089190]|uniref:HNH endonuclease n=1 Tax=Microbacterium sp. NPDC089190 TaxID=3155063 RepID=UPI00344CAD39